MLKNNWVALLLIGLCFHLVSCKQEALNEKELYTYLKDESNGLIHKWKEDPFEISVMYKPSSLLAKQELGNETDPVKIKEITDRYNDYVYFVLNYAYKEGEVLNAFAGDRRKFADLVNVLSFQMREKVSIITDQKQKVQLADFIHSRHYGMGGGSMVLLVFDKKEVLSKTNNNFKLKLKDIGIGIGNQKYTYQKANIGNCPKLKLSYNEK